MPPKSEKITKAKARAIKNKLAKHYTDPALLAAVEAATDRADIAGLVLDAAGVNLNDYVIG